MMQKVYSSQEMRFAVEQRNKKTANARARRNGNGGQCAPQNYNSVVWGQCVNTSSIDKKQSQRKIRLLLGTISLEDEGGP